MKRWIVVIAIFVSPLASAMEGIEVHTFRCSNGRDYDVAFHVNIRFGRAIYDVLALCSHRTFSRNSLFYQVPDRETNPEYDRCLRDRAKDVTSCGDEFMHLNDLEGEGQPKIYHGRE